MLLAASPGGSIGPASPAVGYIGRFTHAETSSNNSSTNSRFGYPGIVRQDGALDPAALRSRHPSFAAFLEVGVETFIEEWLSQPLFGSFPREQAGVEARCRNTAEGLARSLLTSGTGVQASLWQRLGELTMPVLVLAGELDAKFTDIARRMAEQIPSATFESIPGAGHAAHGEQPEATAEIVAAWLTA